MQVIKLLSCRKKCSISFKLPLYVYNNDKRTQWPKIECHLHTQFLFLPECFLLGNFQEMNENIQCICTDICVKCYWLQLCKMRAEWTTYCSALSTMGTPGRTICFQIQKSSSIVCCMCTYYWNQHIFIHVMNIQVSVIYYNYFNPYFH